MKKETIEQMLAEAKQKYYDNLPQHVKEVVDYYKPKMDVAHLVNLPNLLKTNSNYNYDMTVIILNHPDKIDFDNPELDINTAPILLDYVFGVYDNLDDALEYELIYKALDRYGLVAEYNKKFGGK